MLTLYRLITQTGKMASTTAAAKGKRKSDSVSSPARKKSKDGQDNEKKNAGDKCPFCHKVRHEDYDPMAESYTFFYGIASPFSQFHPCRFTVDGQRYNCAEQYMMHQKAVVFKDDDMAQKILKSTVPKEQKAFGRKVQNFDPGVWSKEGGQAVRRGNKAKFTQNPELKEQLLSTTGTVLVESSPRDRLWGIGLGKDNPKAKHKCTWRGRNLLGYALTDVREDILKEEGKQEQQDNE